MELTKKEVNALNALKRARKGIVPNGKPELYEPLIAKGLAIKRIGAKGYEITKLGTAWPNSIEMDEFIKRGV